MSFGGPTPSAMPPSGPFEASMSQIASSPYTLAAAIFLLNIGGRFLPMEISRGQEQFLNQPWFRRTIIFVIFFVATRNLVTAAWLSLLMILCIGYLFNENSSLFIFGKSATLNDAAKSISLTAEEQNILRTLTEKSEKIKAAAATPLALAKNKASTTHDKYQKILRGLWAN